jgi:hypothetical protein
MRRRGATALPSILELAFIGPTPDKRWRSLELFGTKVLPRMRELQLDVVR